MSLDSVHRFIERLDRDPACLKAFQADPRHFMQTTGLSDNEVEQLHTASRDALDGLGVHPLLQIRYLRARFPERGSFMSINDWSDRLPLGVHHG